MLSPELKNVFFQDNNQIERIFFLSPSFFVFFPNGLTKITTLEYDQFLSKIILSILNFLALFLNLVILKLFLINHLSFFETNQNFPFPALTDYYQMISFSDMLSYLNHYYQINNLSTNNLDNLNNLNITVYLSNTDFLVDNTKINKWFETYFSEAKIIKNCGDHESSILAFNQYLVNVN